MGDPTTPPVALPQKTDFNIGEEFGTAKRNLPPAKIVAICLAILAVVVSIFAFLHRSKPQGAGTIDYVTGIEIPGQKSVLVALTVTLRNSAEKPLWIHTLKAQLTTADGKTFDDVPASAVDHDRYYEAFPVLKGNAKPALTPETKIVAGAERSGTMIFSFPVDQPTFDQRKSISLNIQPYDQPLPVILSK